MLLLLCILLGCAARREPLIANWPEGLLSSKSRLMVFSPHPDDETLAAGGLIQRVLQAGGTVKVVFVTSGDGFPEGVQMALHVSTPTAEDYRKYGELREQEAVDGLGVLGVSRKDIVLLGFPDGGLCAVLSERGPADGPAHRSPFTLADRPPARGSILPDARYNAAGLGRELSPLLEDFRPTLVVTTQPRDRHPDHCATYFAVRRALREVQARDVSLHPEVLTFLIHFGAWPVEARAGLEDGLVPLPELRENGLAWTSLPLTPSEVDTKRRAIREYHTQRLVMNSYLSSFARTNELFVRDQSEDQRQLQAVRCCQE